MSPLDVDREEFERLVAEALDDVPEPFAEALTHVAVVVDERAPRGHPPLFGLYTGVPIIHGRDHSGMLPPRITIFVHPLVDVCRTPEELAHQVRVTVLHEIGHHMGLSEDRLHELGYG